MAITCIAQGIWDTVNGSPPFYSREQYRATVLLILCQWLVDSGTLPNMSACTVPGLWDQIKGTPPFMSEEQFMAEHLNLLCQLATSGGGGGGGGAGGVTVAGGAPPTDGSIDTLFYKDSTTGFKYINLGTEAVPDWDVI